MCMCLCLLYHNVAVVVFIIVRLVWCYVFFSVAYFTEISSHKILLVYFPLLLIVVIVVFVVIDDFASCCCCLCCYFPFYCYSFSFLLVINFKKRLLLWNLLRIVSSLGQDVYSYKNIHKKVFFKIIFLQWILFLSEG